MLQAILNKSWRQHPTKQQLYGHLLPITKTIQVRRTRHAGHSWRNRDDILLWTPLYGRAKAGRPARTYILQLCADRGCSPEDLLETIDNREGWRDYIGFIFIFIMSFLFFFPSTVLSLFLSSFSISFYFHRLHWLHFHQHYILCFFSIDYIGFIFIIIIFFHSFQSILLALFSETFSSFFLFHRLLWLYFGLHHYLCLH